MSEVDCKAHTHTHNSSVDAAFLCSLYAFHFTSLQVAYIDLTGSGIETIAHLKENGRITLMTCSFEPELAQILRIYGKGRVYAKESDGKAFDEWLDKAFTSRKIDWTINNTLKQAVR